MTAIRDRVLFLQSIEEFAGLDGDALLLLVENATERTYEAGDVLIRAGEEPHSIYVLIDGEVALRRRKRPDLIVRKREAFGLIAVMSDTPAEDAVVVEAARILEIPVRGFRAALEENFSLIRNVLKIMGALIAAMRHQLPADPKKPPKVEIGHYYEKPRTLVEQLVELRKGPFVHMNIDALVDLARRMTEVRVPAGHVFWSAGDECSYALHVEYGCVRCTVPEGQHVDVGSDFTIGVMDLWSLQPRSYAARSETDIIAYRIEYEDFLAISEMHIGVAIDMLRGLANQYLLMDQDDVVLG